MDDLMEGIVVDIGSGYIKCGFGGDDAPRAVFPSIVGKPKSLAALMGMERRERIVGDECIAKSEILNSLYPIHRGWMFKENDDDIEALLHHIPYGELCIAPEEHRYLYSECVLTSKRTRELLAEKSFESFSLPAISNALSPYLSFLPFFGNRNHTGINIEVGDGVTQVSAMIDGESQCYFRSDVGGRDVTYKLFELLQKSGQISNNAGRGIGTSYIDNLRYLKEIRCFVSLDPKKEKSEPIITLFHKLGSTLHSITDDKVLRLDEERFEAPEILFTKQYNKKRLSVPQLVDKAIRSCGKENWKILRKNIVINGGSTMFRGFEDRLALELVSMDKNLRSEDFRIHASEERKYTTWIGGSMVESSSHFKKFFITRDQYDEEGMRIIHRLVIK